MRNIVILNSLHFSYPLPILMRVSYNTLIVKQNTSDYYKYTKNHPSKELFWNYSKFSHPKNRNYSIFRGAVIQIKCKIKSTAVKSMIYLQKNVMQIRSAIKNTIEHTLVTMRSLSSGSSASLV